MNPRGIATDEPMPRCEYLGIVIVCLCAAARVLVPAAVRSVCVAEGQVTSRGSGL